MEKQETYQLDNVDRQILSLLMKDSRIPFTDVARKVFVSPGTVHVRMRKMEEQGIVKGSRLMIDPSAIGYDITAFLGIFLVKSSMYDEVMKALEKIPEIVDCHYTTGAYSMFLKLICRDTKHLKEILHEKIQAIEGIERTETLVSLEQSIQRPLQIS